MWFKVLDEILYSVIFFFNQSNSMWTVHVFLWVYFKVSFTVFLMEALWFVTEKWNEAVRKTQSHSVELYLET